jgi:hypothetical protein
LIPTKSAADSRFSRRVDGAIGRAITERRIAGALLLAPEDGLVVWSDPTADKDAGLTDPLADRISPRWAAEVPARPTSAPGRLC